MPFKELAKAINVIFDLTENKIKCPHVKVFARRLKECTSAWKDENGEKGGQEISQQQRNPPQEGWQWATTVLDSYPITLEMKIISWNVKNWAIKEIFRRFWPGIIMLQETTKIKIKKEKRKKKELNKRSISFRGTRSVDWVFSPVKDQQGVWWSVGKDIALRYYK